MRICQIEGAAEFKIEIIWIQISDAAIFLVFLFTIVLFVQCICINISI